MNLLRAEIAHIPHDCFCVWSPLGRGDRFGDEGGAQRPGRWLLSLGRATVAFGDGPRDIPRYWRGLL